MGGGSRPVPDLRRRLVAECAATALLLATVVGSGIMAERLAGGNAALALLANALATGEVLPVLILAFGPVSGAHMNPAVTAMLAVRRARPEAVPYAVGLYITGAYWFTASTSFANPAVTLARSLTDSFAGIAPGDVAAFVVVQMAAALAAGVALAGGGDWFRTGRCEAARRRVRATERLPPPGPRPTSPSPAAAAVFAAGTA